MCKWSNDQQRGQKQIVFSQRPEDTGYMMEVVSWEPLETLGRRVAPIKYKKAMFSKVSERT
jgi:N-acetylneuraminic acid mutarotase